MKLTANFCAAALPVTGNEPHSLMMCRTWKFGKRPHTRRPHELDHHVSSNYASIRRLAVSLSRTSTSDLSRNGENDFRMRIVGGIGYEQYNQKDLLRIFLAPWLYIIFNEKDIREEA